MDQPPGILPGSVGNVASILPRFCRSLILVTVTGIPALPSYRFVGRRRAVGCPPSVRYALSSVILGSVSDPIAAVYDAVTLWLPAEMTEPPGQRFFHALSTCEERTDAYTGEVYYFGTLDNLRVRSKADGVSINGSLARFHFGDNLETLTCQQTGEVLERLSDTLGVPIASAKVTTLEFGSNLLLDRRPVEYFAHLGHASLYRRSEINMRNGFGLYYSNSRRELGFYDKIREMKNRKGRKTRIPESLIGRNLMRYELRLLRNVGDQLATMNTSSADAIDGASPRAATFGQSVAASSRSASVPGTRHQRAAGYRSIERPTIKAGRLPDPEFYNGLVNRWEQEYRAIRRRTTARTLSGPIGGPRVFKDQLAALGIERLGGAEAVIAELRSSKQRGEIDPQHYKRNKQLVEELAASPVLTIEPALIAEVDRVVSETADRYR